jgi:ATP-dependent phosphofructokinase / diphosphate-dependent phosphofructokinase
MAKLIGLLTSGGDTPGLNAAIRAIGKAALSKYKMEIVGFQDGFRGLMENRFISLNSRTLSGILTVGGTILGTSREKPNKMHIGGKMMDMTDVIVENYEKNHLDVLICLGGGGTQKNAYHLHKQGLNVVTLPKTIDNDIAQTDITFGFDTALGIATEAVDRLHSTAHSHHRIIVVETMGHRAGWLALGAGVSGGADVILIPEIPYDINIIAESILTRSRTGKKFSIVAIAEGSVSKEMDQMMQPLLKKLKAVEDKEEKEKLKEELGDLERLRSNNTLRLSHKLEQLTGLESRVTILGHLQRGGTPSAGDRLLATRLGTAAVEYIDQDVYGVMIAAKGKESKPVPLERVVGKRKIVSPDHPWIQSARLVDTCLGD